MMANKSDGKGRGKRDPAIIAAWVAGTLGVVGIVVGVLLTHVLAGSSQPSTVSSTPPVAVRLTSPAPGTDVSQTKVFGVTGTVGHLGNDTLWLTDYDGGYAVDDEATVNTNGTWRALNSNVGNPHQPLPFALSLRVILASTECAAKLQEAMNSDADYLTVLPGGCAVAGAVTVNVTSR
jgi:hypothetical protein